MGSDWVGAVEGIEKGGSDVISRTKADSWAFGKDFCDHFEQVDFVFCLGDEQDLVVGGIPQFFWL